LVGISRQRVEKLVAAGTLPSGAAAGVQLHAYIANLRELSYSDDPKLVESRRRLSSARAESAEMDLAERRGESVNVADVEKRWGEMVTSFRARMLLLPPTAAPLVAAPDRIPEAQAILQKFVYEALSELAGDGVPK
jgi:hypothetical protein